MSDYLGPDERRALLRVARDGLEAAVLGRPPEPVPGELAGHLGAPGACFVTLVEGGELRGCIGGLEASEPLSQAARAMAAAAALRDPRFRPVQPAELPRVELSLSVLTPLRRLVDPAELEVGRHGLVVTRGGHRGVLLPQVAVEHGWDRAAFLARTCQKAGLPLDAWRDPETVLEVFSAEVVREEH